MSESGNGIARAIDHALERVVVSCLLYRPTLLDIADPKFDLDAVADFQAQRVFTAIVNMREKHGVAAISPRAIAKHLTDAGDVIDPWYGRLVDMAPDPIDPMLFVERTRSLVRLAAKRAHLIDEADEPARSEAEIDEIALRDAEVPAPPRMRWIVPLDRFLGDTEPSDDDREDWYIRDVIPRGEALLIAGPPKCGKTWAMLDMGIAAALGQPWLKHENTVGEPIRVLLLGYEDGLRRFRKRIWELCRAHGTTPNDRVLREHLIVSREPLSLPGDEKAFTAELKQWKPSLVLIDNLTRVMVGDPNATRDAARFGNVWVKICNDVGTGMGLLHHTAKIGPLAFADRNAGDPFELVKGNGDFVAVARHIILTRPIDAPGEKLSDVRMRGNLDLRCESFVTGFDRIQVDDRWHAKLQNLGDGDSVRQRLAADRKEKAETAKKAELAAEYERRRAIALDIMNRDGSCSTRRLADAIGLKSPRSVQPVFDALVSAKIARQDGNRGYVFADDGAAS